jgi:hypothetical protein
MLMILLLILMRMTATTPSAFAVVGEPKVLVCQVSKKLYRVSNRTRDGPADPTYQNS